MDIERVQKINNLALELMNQGLVPDREEAIKHAERILVKKDYSSLSESREGVKELNLDEEKKEKAGEKEEELGQDKIKEILSKNTDFIVGKMRGFQEEISKLKEEINILRSELNRLGGKISELKAREEARAKSEARKEEPQKKLESGQATNKESSDSGGEESHPRSGNYSNQDVSIEKFFYAGNKPKD